jgi:hypothetical protein
MFKAGMAGKAEGKRRKAEAPEACGLEPET